MALPLCNLQPLAAFPIRQRKLPIKTTSLHPRFHHQKTQLQFISHSKKPPHYISPVKSASVNGYLINQENETSYTDSGNIELGGKLKKWVKLVREILPGGEWWRLPTQEAEGVISAKPVTVFRALKKMWELIAQDRWVVSTAFVALKPNYEVPVLQHFNLTVHPGEVVALVGHSGSGKSTVVNLLLRLYEPTNGEILIDGHPLNTLNIKWLRERIGYVGQEPRLFRMDVSSNIRYGCPRDVSQQDVEWAAKQAFAHDFISSLPDGYQTLVDDDLLSGGQKQRIAIARAILRDPSILILNDATSALDAESEHNVKGVLGSVQSDLKTKRTVFVIAHRLSTIQTAARIIVMDGGKIVETGSHTELLREDGLYARLIRRQADAVA